MDSREQALQIEQLITSVKALCRSAVELEQEFARELSGVDESCRDSARNLLHYMAIRRRDIRRLQQDLRSLGLSSLTLLEPHVMANLAAVLYLLEKVSGSQSGTALDAPVDFRGGPGLLKRNTAQLLGDRPAERSTRIMVTMPSEAATDPGLVRRLLAGGMDVMRINCARDTPRDWAAMVANLRRAEQELGRNCTIQADLPGPKVRTGALRSGGRMLKVRVARDHLGQVARPSKVWLAPAGESLERPDNINLTIPLDPTLLGQVQAGDLIEIPDARKKRRRLVADCPASGGWVARSDRVIYAVDDGQAMLIRNGAIVGKGPVGPLPELCPPITLFPNEKLILTRENLPGQGALRDSSGSVLEAARIHCTLDAAFEQVKAGEGVWFDDGKIGGVVESNSGSEIVVRITHTRKKGGRLRAERGINFPDTTLDTPSLTQFDLDCLSEAVAWADMVALSFLRRPEDVLQLIDQLRARQAEHLGIVLKIENREAYDNLAKIILAGMRSPPVGVLIARGDLAVEMGFERLSEVQEDILCVCEAAHAPVILATQVLERMSKKGVPSRAEVSDAAMSSRAECTMLSKGPYIAETVRFLGDVLTRMDSHRSKRRATLRRLSVSEFS
ncbi:MAG: pyruvate kinase [Xanthomonadales bacterium]|nr:pyruvate kinase [Xanthomonadales bacterium]